MLFESFRLTGSYSYCTALGFDSRQSSTRKSLEIVGVDPPERLPRPVERFLSSRSGDVIHPGLEDFVPWPSPRSRRSPLSVDAALYHDLLTKVGGDVGKLERLIEYERRRAPLAGETELYEYAIRRWERDNQ